MTNLIRDEKDLSKIIISLILVIAILTGVVIWLAVRLDHKNNSIPKINNQIQSNLPKASNNKKVVLKTYCDELNIGCLTYPSNWTLNTQTLNKVPTIQIASPLPSQNIVAVSYRINANSPGTSAHDSVIGSFKFNTPIDGLSIEEAIMSNMNTPYLAVVDSNSIWNHTKGNNNWSLIALPSGQPFSNSDQATKWFSTSEAKAALQIIESYTYK
ncbi:MAG TPA: hypothetical protein VLF63_02215 [Patescibacteria group bacterium]|nr:hypothetical protein [Patescibacteria group bacterium]